MKKNELFDGTWLEYQNELKKYITEKAIHDNWTFFIECYQMGALPENASKWL